MAWGFTVMSILMIPCIISNSISGYLQDYTAKSNLDYLTPANQKSIDDGEVDPSAKDIINDTMVYRGLLVGGDMAYCVFFVIFIFVFKFVARLWINQVKNSREVALSDYTVYVTGLPRQGISVDEIWNHFAKIVTNKEEY